jgi:hypothetical protein
MPKMVRSTIAPENIEIDIVKNGSIRILCHWNIVEVAVEDEAGPRTEYEYAERAIWWALPSPAYVAQDETGRQILTTAGQEYLQSVADEILGWAQAAAV